MRSELPENWCIRRTSENADYLNEWFNATYKSNYHYDFGYMRIHNGKPDKTSVMPTGYTEITLEEFRHFVVNARIKKKEDLELKGLYRQRIKQLTDENIELRYENKQLWEHLTKQEKQSSEG